MTNATSTPTPNPLGGPRTIEGKENSARNALKHGSCSTATLILENESLEDYLVLEQRWFKGYGVDPNRPDSEFEVELVRTAARADWFYQRSDRNYAEAEAKIMETVPDVLQWEDSHHRAIARFLRYRTTHANTLAKHRRAIESYIKTRGQQYAHVQKMQHATQKMEMAKERLAIYKHKNREINWQDEIDKMKQAAETHRQCEAQKQAETQAQIGTYPENLG